MTLHSLEPLHEIAPPAGGPARYTQRALPAYRYVPGLHPHPIIHPQGHSFNPAGQHPAPGPLLACERWPESEDYLFGIDLHNGGYWWEAHEAWEGLWQQTDKAGPQGQFLQGLIQISAAHLKRHVRQPAGVERLLAHAINHLALVPVDGARAGVFMGLNLPGYLDAVQSYFRQSDGPFPFITVA